ncbi:MAG TPA: phosphate ABC transporter substrate-binding protein [Candidatus Alectryocaccobium stercorigallinarum]|nr:phosphate ABC transporter substrate-binding protein [Candidatus Alectryocaccobium stercorigallinarum]
MRTRKIAAIALSAMVGASLFAGCGNSADSNADASTTEESNSAESDTTEESAAAEEDTSSEENADAASELSGSVSTNGSTSMESVIGTLMEQFMADNPGVTITYDPTGSGTGIEAASNGTCDIGLASRALKAEEEENGLTGTTVALDGIAIIVNANNEVADLSIEDIAGIFTGEITNWSELGGADLEISCIGREAGSGTRDGFESITETEDLCQLDQELTSTGAVIAAVGSNENAIGYASLSAVEGQEGITAITVNGVECSEATVLDGTYEIQRPFTLVTSDSKELSEAAQAFFDYMISADAADLIREAGAVPVAE